MAIAEKSIAVLPFTNLSQDRDNAYFADGIQDEILTRLSKIADLKVTSRTSTQHYKSAPENLSEIARELGVAHILEGSVQKSGDAVRVNVQLIKAANDSHLWADSFDRKLTDIFAVESDIATTVADTLQAKLTGAEKRAISSRPTENPEAHLLYLKGRYHVQKLSKEELNKGLDYFKQAIALDPNYALAYDGIAYYHFVAIDWLASVSDLGPTWMAAARKAVELDDTLAEAHTELANAYFWYEWNWSAAEQEFKRAIQLEPRYASAHEYYGWYLVLMGKVDAGIAEFRQALEIDPLAPETYALFGWNLWALHRYDDAMEQLRKSLELDPNDWWTHATLGRCYLGKKMPSQAATEFQKALSIENAFAEPLAGLGLAYAAQGNRTKALKMVNELQERAKQSYVSPYFIASVYGAVEANDQAFACLEAAYQNRSWYLLALKVSPDLDSLRSDPRFQALVQKVFTP
jgi:TolB-like protein/Tfp pilus assembly protein PilF